MKITIVVAAALDNAIGRNNDLMWKLPADLKFLKNKTWGLPVLMGRKTWDSLQGQPLKGRPNLVLSRQTLSLAGAITINNIEEADNWARVHGYQEICLLGGAQLYKQFMDRVDTIFMTRVQTTFPEADAFFPPIDETTFTLHHSDAHSPDERHAFGYHFQEWRRLK